MHKERVLQLARGNQKRGRGQISALRVMRYREARNQSRRNDSDDHASTEIDTESAHTPLYITATEVVTEKRD